MKTDQTERVGRVVRSKNASVSEDQVWRIVSARLRSVHFVQWAVGYFRAFKAKEWNDQVVWRRGILVMC